MDPEPTAAQPRITTCDPVPGYTPHIGRYVAQLNEVRAHLREQVAGLTIADIDWHPNDQVESIGTSLLHIAAVEWSWMHEDIFGTPDDAYPGVWDEALPIRVGRPQVQGRPPAVYLQHLDLIRAQTLQILRGFTDADLARRVGAAELPPGQEQGSRLYSIDWIIWHILEHEAAHNGQIELLRRLAPAGPAQRADGNA
ncbi:MAG TPA: DinB family protein [Chloroflexia bacterium]|nr:DinB family protein [Chloroflexia bacterium]